MIFLQIQQMHKLYKLYKYKNSKKNFFFHILQIQEKQRHNS